MPERFRADILLAAAPLDGAHRGLRVVEAEVVTAAADGLRAGRPANRLAPRLGQFALGLQDSYPTAMVLLQCAAEDRRNDEDKPPVAADEVSYGMHGFIFPQSRRHGQTSVGDGEFASLGAA